MRKLLHPALARAACGLALGLSLVAGCSPTRGYCEASADCDDFVFGIDSSGDADDDVAVCSANVDGTLAALRANEEEECQEFANALEAYFACASNAFAGGEDGCDAISEECEDELEDAGEASEDIKPGECSSSED